MVTIENLVRVGFLREGDKLCWTRPRAGVSHFAAIQSDGSIRTDDGVLHKSPSGAARHHYQKPIDGWSAWKVIRLSKSLSQIRAEYSAQEK